jgi:hypothetical protein
MMTRFRTFSIVAALLGMVLMFSGCDSYDGPTVPLQDQNEFPSIQEIQVSPNAQIFVDDTITLTPQTTDPNNDIIRYVWSKDAGDFNPVEAVGPSIDWTAPSTRGTYRVIAIGDDGNGGTSQRQIDLDVYGGNQSGTVDVVAGVRANPVGGVSAIGYIDTGDTLTLVWDSASPVTTDSTRPDETKYAPDGSRLNTTTLAVISPPQFGFSEGLPVRDAARYSLIGRIGEGEWFEFIPGPDTNGNGIPNSYSVVAPARGRIFLSLNEQDALLVDNTGFWRFAFTIAH